MINTLNFCDDGKVAIYPTDAFVFGVKLKLDTSHERRRSSFNRCTLAQQYISRTGTLFVRVLLDQNDTVTFICLENRRLIASNNHLLLTVRSLIAQLKELAQSIDRNTNSEVK